MNSRLIPCSGCARALFALFCGLSISLQSLLSASAATNTIPTISTQPANGIAAIGEDFAFSVVASGNPLPAYQWFYNGSALTDQTNSTLVSSNLSAGSAGTYSVSVANVAGSITSSNALLTIVLTNTAHRLETGRVVQNGSTVAVPIILRANGRENAVSFSLNYNVGVYSNPRMIGSTNFTLNLSQTGTVGLAMTLPAGGTLPAGYDWLGLLEFDLSAGHGPLDGGLSFTTNPVPIAAVSALGTALMISAAVQPQYVATSSAPTLNLQSGLFEQRLVVSNPGADPMTNINILALNLGIDSVSNVITFYNSQGTIPAYPFGDALIDVPCDCQNFPIVPDIGKTNLITDAFFAGYLACGANQCALDFTGTNIALPFAQITNLVAGESRTVTIELYVPDHFTVPPAKYSLYLADPLLLSVPQTATVLSIDAIRYSNGAFLVEFTTQLGMRYFIQYASTPEGLANPQTVFPAVTGTGTRVQWLDNGPPKTDSPPVNGARFYRVVQNQ